MAKSTWAFNGTDNVVGITDDDRTNLRLTIAVEGAPECELPLDTLDDPDYYPEF